MRLNSGRKDESENKMNSTQQSVKTKRKKNLIRLYSSRKKGKRRETTLSMNESELEGKTKQSVKTKDSRFVIVHCQERLSKNQ